MNSTLNIRALASAMFVVATLATWACQQSPTAPDQTPNIAAAGLTRNPELPTSSGMAVTSNVAIPAGWASQTRFRYTDTVVQRNVVSTALAAVGGLSGRSFIVSRLSSTTPWLTDASAGDGQRMRNATNRYHQWVLSNPKTLTLTQVKAQMRQDLSATYDALRQQMLVDRIIVRHNLYTMPGGPARSSDQEIMDFLQVQKQCLEFAATVGLVAGGRAKGYSSAAVTSPAAYRAGMGLFKADRSHAMLIVDVLWDSAGRATRFKVVEANWGSGWMNPVGMVPWERRVTTREVTVGDRVINFESQ